MTAIPDVVIKNGRIVTAHEVEHRQLFKGAAILATLLAAGLGGYFLGQNRAKTNANDSPLTAWLDPVQPSSAVVTANPQTPPSAPSEPASHAQTTPGSPDSPNALQSAVAASFQNGSAVSYSDRKFVQAQHDYLRQSAESPEQIKARLDRLASNPEALEAHNRSVTNRVTATQNHVATQDLMAAVQASQKILQAASYQDSLNKALKNEASVREADAKTYVVRAGDTLWAIASRLYGDPYQYKRLFQANPRVLAAPEHIFPGQILRVPA